jgi:hypothetical protein
MIINVNLSIIDKYLLNNWLRCYFPLFNRKVVLMVKLFLSAC